MRRNSYYLLLVAMLILGGILTACVYQIPTSAAAPLEAVDDVEAVTAAVNEIWEQYAASVNAGDVEGWISLWTDDGIQMRPNSPSIVGKEAIRARRESAAELFSVEMEIINEEVQTSGDWAIARGIYTAVLTPKAGGEETFVDGKYMTLLQRQPDGSWKIYRDIFNSNVPPN